MTRERIYWVVLCLFLVVVAIFLVHRWRAVGAPPALPAAQASPTPAQPIALPPGMTVLEFPSRVLDRTVPVSVLLPPAYHTSGLCHPVLYFLHGYGDNHLGWPRSNLKELAAEKGWIVVVPNGGTGFYINSAQGRYEDFFLTELIPHIDQTYRTIDTRAGRAIAGISMGGYGAWHLALASPQTFSSACSMSGVLTWGEPEMLAMPWAIGNAQELYGETYGKDYSAGRLWPLVEASHRSGQCPALYSLMGTGDSLLQSNRTINERLRQFAIPNQYDEFPGAHNALFWIEHMPDVVAFHARHLAAPVVPASQPTTRH